MNKKKRSELMSIVILEILANQIESLAYDMANFDNRLNYTECLNYTQWLVYGADNFVEGGKGGKAYRIK